MNKHLSWYNEANVAQLVMSIKGEKISICTTDTVFGLVGIATKYSFEQLNKIKGRYEKPYLILIPSKEKAYDFIDLDCKKLKDLINQVWPGPVTLIFKAKQEVPNYMKSKNGTIALRIPKHKGLQTVMKAAGPLFSTSANRAGQSIPATIEQISLEVMKQIDLIITNGKCHQKDQPSTILDCTDPESIKVVREGAFLVKNLHDFIV